MDIALKQRLVGAVVIVALGVIFIPMLLDGPGDDAGAPLEVRIPDPPDGRYETRRLPLNPGAEPAPAREDASPEPASREPVAGPASREVPEVVVAAPSAELESDAAVAPPPSENRAPAPAPEPPAAAPALDGEWVLQLGSFTRRENAERLVTRAREAGYEAWSDLVTAGDTTLHRVRVGAWDERDEAMAVAARIGELMALGDGISLRRLGSDGEDDPGSTGPADEAPGFGWWVQAGVFSSEENATGLQDRLREAGFVARAEPIRLGGETHYRVRVGPQLDREEAEAVKLRLDREFGIRGLVVTNP